MRLHKSMGIILLATKLTILLMGCSHNPRAIKTTIIERMGAEDDAPSWVHTGKSMWEDKGKLMAIGMVEVEGDANKNACLEMATLNAKLNLISYISQSGMKQATTSIESIDSESTYQEIKETITQGRLEGVNEDSRYFELRLRANQAEVLTERLTCYSKISISKKIAKKKIKRAITSVEAKGKSNE